MTKGWPLIASLLLIATNTFAGGVNLAWNACHSEAGIHSKTFACNSNAGNQTVWGSFSTSVPHDSCVGIEAVILIQTQSDTIPSWWQLFNAGSCRASALSVSFDFTSAPNEECHDFWQGAAQGGIAAYHTFSTIPPAPGGAARLAEIKVAAAVPWSVPIQLEADTEYYAFRLVVSNTSTIGSCSGCAVPACIAVSYIRIADASGTTEELTQPLVAANVTWQSAEAECPATRAKLRRCVKG